MTPGVLLSAVLVKCETRAQQIGVVIGMALFVFVLVVVGLWMYQMGNASLETISEFEESSGHQDSGIYRMMFYFYAGAAICALLGLLFSAVGIVNLVRFLTNTGLKDNDDW